MNKVINTHASDLRDEVTKIIETDGPGGFIEDSLAECIEQTVLCIGLLGSPAAVMTLPSNLIHSTQKQLLKVQSVLIARLQDLTNRAANRLTTHSDDPKGGPQK